MIQRFDLSQWCAIFNNQIFVVEQHKGEMGFAWQLLLVVDEGVEAADGIVTDRPHGTGTVENAGDFSQIRVHGNGSSGLIVRDQTTAATIHSLAT
jgi:hypothetical protein